MADAGIAPEWRACKGFPEYEVSDQGDVRRFGRVLKPWVSRLGYLEINLRRDGKTFRCKAHRIVAQAFIGDPPPRHEVDHINGQRGDNRAVNLRWVTHAENMAARAPGSRGLRKDGALTEAQARDILRRRREGESLKVLAAEFGITIGMVSHIGRGQRWAYIHTGTEIAA